jgi:putative Mg2+ transporter-C (MgtC) family protein
VPTDPALALRIGVGFALAFVVGFERELRNSAAGDRTFALVGGAAAAVTAVVAKSSPQAIAGVITGLGFIGAGVVVHGEGGLIKGVTTAGALFATAGVGIVVGTGHLALGALTAVLVLFILELRNLPGLRRLDARRYETRFRDDYEPPMALRRHDADHFGQGGR